MYYTIAEVEKIVKISKSAIYKKIKTNEFKPYISKKQGITYIDDTGLKMIQDSINTFVKESTVVELEPVEIPQTKDFEPANKQVAHGEIDSKYIKHLENEVDRLWEQVQTLTRLVENSQVLLREQPQQNIQLLQEHFDQTEEKIGQVKEKMQDKQVAHEAEHKSFWSRFWGVKKKDY